MKITKTYLPLMLVFLITYHTCSAKSFSFKELVPSNIYTRYGEALEAVFTLGWRLQSIVNTSPDENFVVSPLSTAAVIAQLMIGAKGEFREQLFNLLSLPKSTSTFNVTYFSKERNESQILPYANFHLQFALLLKTLRQRKPGEQFTLNLNNGLFYNQYVDLKSVFTGSLDKLYNTEIMKLDFNKDTRSTINKWVSDHTNGLIKSILDSPLSPNTASMFLNSVYFQAEWETPFSEMLNTEGDFQITPTNSVKTAFMMNNILDIPFAETPNFKVVCLPYKNKELGMYIVLPNNKHEQKFNIKRFAENLNPQELLQALEEMKLRDVTVKMPKLSLSNSLDLLKPLQKYALFEKWYRGQPKAENPLDEISKRGKSYRNFTASTEEDILLENAAINSPLIVSNINQQLVFSLNEKGTEAAAVTASIMDYMGGSKTVILNRPFSFFIRHEETQAVLFWGTISNPARR